MVLLMTLIDKIKSDPIYTASHFPELDRVFKIENFLGCRSQQIFTEGSG